MARVATVLGLALFCAALPSGADVAAAGFVVPVLATLAAAAPGIATAAGITGTLLTAVTIVSTVLTVAAGVLGSALSKRPTQREQGVPTSIRQAVSPRRWLFGQKRIGGFVVHFQLTRRNKRLLYIIALSDYPCRGPVRVFFDEEIVWERNGGAEPTNGDLAAYGTWQNNWDTFAYGEWYDGTQVAASPYFTSESRNGGDAPNEDNASIILSAPTGVQVTTATAPRTGTKVVDGVEVSDNYDVTEVSVSWSAATGGTVTQYRVEYRAASGEVAVEYVSGAVTSLVVGTTDDYNPSRLRPEVSAQDTSGNWTDSVDEGGATSQRLPVWGADRVGTNVCYAAFELRWDKKRRRFPGGAPSITVEMEGRKDIFDPRTLLTGYTRNASLLIRELLRDRVVGLGLPASRVGDAKFAAHANLSDEQVVNATGGTEPRYEAAGLVQADEGRTGIILDACAASGSDPVLSSGQYFPVSGKTPLPVGTLTDADLRGEVKWDFGRGLRERFNSVGGNFEPPQTRYVTTPYPTVRDADAVARDGEEVTRSVNMPFVNSSGQAERLARAILREGRKRRFLSVVVRWGFLRYEIGDVLTVTLARWGISDLDMKIEGMRVAPLKPNQRLRPITMQLSVADPDQFEASQGDLTPYQPPPVPLPAELVPPPSSPVLSVETSLRPDGTSFFRSVVTWGEAPSDDVAGYFVTYRLDEQTTSAFVEGTRLEVERGISNVSVQTASGDGRRSAPALASVPPTYPERDTEPPDAPTPVAVDPIVSNTLGEVVVRLENSTADDFAAFRLYVSDPGAGFGSATLETQARSTRLVLRELVFDQSYDFYATEVDESGNESAPTLLGTATPSDLLVDTAQIAPNAVTEELTEVSDGRNLNDNFNDVANIPFVLGVDRRLQLTSKLILFNGNNFSAATFEWRLRVVDVGGTSNGFTVVEGSLDVPINTEVTVAELEGRLYEVLVPVGQYELQLEARNIPSISDAQTARAGSGSSLRYWKR